MTDTLRIDEVAAVLDAPPAHVVYTIASGGDLTGDGARDILVATQEQFVGATPEFWVLERPLSGVGDLASAAALRFGPKSPLWAGAHDAGDLDGDGLASIVFPGFDPARLVFVEAPLADGLEPDASGQVLLAAPELGEVFSWFGHPGDTDGDGRAEVPVGMTHAFADSGVGLLLGEPSGSTGDLASEARAVLTLAGGIGVGVTTTVLGDLDADGFDDLAVGVIGDDYDQALAGEPLAHVYLLYGPVRGYRDLADADATFAGLHSDHGSVGLGYVGDVDGDRHPDIAIGDWGSDREKVTSSIHLFLGGSAL